MKKTLIFTTVLLLASIFFSVSTAMAGNLHTWKLFDAVTISAGGSSTLPATSADPIDLQDFRPSGIIGFMVTISGSGTAKGEYLLTSDPDVAAIEPATATDIFSGVTAGTYIYYSDIELQRYLRIKITETGSANSVTVTVYITVEGDI